VVGWERVEGECRVEGLYMCDVRASAWPPWTEQTQGPRRKGMQPQIQVEVRRMHRFIA
jgi:hypothetical protein